MAFRGERRARGAWRCSNCHRPHYWCNGRSFHWWKGRVGDRGRRWVKSNASWWIPAMYVLFFAYVAGPDIYERVAAPPAAPSATAQDIAAAIAPTIKTAIADALRRPTPSQQEAQTDTAASLAELTKQLADVQRRLHHTIWTNMDDDDYEGRPLEFIWQFANVNINPTPTPTNPRALGVDRFSLYGKNFGSQEVQIQEGYVISAIDGTGPLSHSK